MTKEELAQFIADNPFNFDEEILGFTESEIAIIKKYGNWFNGLTEKEIEATTEEEKLFVEELYLKNPTSENVVLWKRYMRKQLVKANKNILNAPPASPNNDGFGSREDHIKLNPNRFDRNHDLE